MFRQAALWCAVVLGLICPAAGRAEVRLSASSVEVHAVGVYEGSLRTEDQLHGPIGRISLDRPGAKVVLLLGSYEPVRWLVSVTPETTLQGVILHGHQPRLSEVIVNDVPSSAVRVEGLPYTYQAQGQRMRALLDMLPRFAGQGQLASFSGAYQAPEAGFVIGPDTVLLPQLQPDFAERQAIAPQGLPAAFRAILGAERPPEPEVVLTEEGFAFRAAGQAAGTETARKIPISLDVPPVSWPVGAARDPKTGRVYGVTLGGEGFVYLWDPASGLWSVPSSMRNADATGAIFDADLGRLVILVPGALYFLDREGKKARTNFDIKAAVGLSDLYDPGNGPFPSLRPLASAEGKLLLLATAGGPHRPYLEDRPGIGHRYYVIDMTTGKIDLVRTTKAVRSEPEPW